MKIVARKDSETRWVDIAGTFRMRVRELTRADLQRIEKLATVEARDERMGTGPRVDEGKKWRAFVRHYIAEWDGLTVEILDALAPLEAGSNEELDVDVGADGFIRLDHDVIALRDDRKDAEAYTLPEYIWHRALSADFALRIQMAARQISEERMRAATELKKSSETSSGAGKAVLSRARATNAGNGKLNVVTGGTGAGADRDVSGTDTLTPAGTC